MANLTDKEVAELKVVLTNKSTDKDLKVWYRLAAKSDATSEAAAGRRLNLGLRHSMRKYYLARKNQRTAETFVKIDPTKNYFFESLEDIRTRVAQTSAVAGKSRVVWADHFASKHLPYVAAPRISQP